MNKHRYCISQILFITLQKGSIILEHNNLIRKITQIGLNNLPENFKYELPYQKLDIFYKIL